MSELINEFSWSNSSSGAFADCRRKRYWSKYVMWGGWSKSAGELQRTAYRLNKMENRFSLQGKAAERAVMWLLREAQAGRRATVDEAYQQVARPFMNQCWEQSMKKMWQADPKSFCCLHEHYYPQHHRTPGKGMTDRVIAVVKLCLANFIEKTLPRLAHVRPEQEIKIATPESGQGVESFIWEHIKIYAIPDYAYRMTDGILHIHDWKTGGPRPSHNTQMAIYGLWANLKHKVEPGQIQVHLEYLSRGAEQSKTLSQNDLDGAQGIIRDSVSEMAEYLIDGDLSRNQPIAREDWELSASKDVCRLCNFFELCESELDG